MSMLVLLHGAPGDGTLWKPVVDLLPPGVEAIAPTLRWFGPEPWHDDGAEFGTEAHAEELIALLHGLAEPAAVAAWSYSTHPALLAMLRRPELFQRSLLFEPGLPSYLDPAEAAAWADDAGSAFGPVAAKLAEEGAAAAVAALFDASGGEGCWAALPDERRARYLAGAETIRLLMGGGRPPAEIGAAELARIDVPVTVAMGGRTRDLFAIPSRAVSRAIPKARLEVVPAADHMLPEKDPAAFAALLTEWLRR